jgi:hypothetical protein
LAPLALAQAAGTILNGSPARLTGRGCYAITFKERRQPARFCNRYVTDIADPTGAGNLVAASAGSDLLSALALVDAFKASDLHVTGVEANIKISRGQRQAFLQRVRLPRRGRAGHTVPATLTLRHVRGRMERRKVRLRLPADLRPGKRRVVFTGADVDTGEGALEELFGFFEVEFDLGNLGGDLGARNVRALVSQIEGLARYDGVSARRPSNDPEDFDPGTPSYRDPDLRISGRARATIRIKR